MYMYSSFHVYLRMLYPSMAAAGRQGQRSGRAAVRSAPAATSALSLSLFVCLSVCAVCLCARTLVSELFADVRQLLVHALHLLLLGRACRAERGAATVRASQPPPTQHSAQWTRSGGGTHTHTVTQSSERLAGGFARRSSAPALASQWLLLTVSDVRDEHGESSGSRHGCRLRWRERHRRAGGRREADTHTHERRRPSSRQKWIQLAVSGPSQPVLSPRGLPTPSLVCLPTPTMLLRRQVSLRSCAHAMVASTQGSLTTQHSRSSRAARSNLEPTYRSFKIKSLPRLNVD